MPNSNQANNNSSYRYYKTKYFFLLFVVYLLGLGISFFVFALTKQNLDYVGILSQGAILATFGAAIMSLADIFERDKLERVKTNIDVFFKDIHKTNLWKRWPFLPRYSNYSLFGNTSINALLSNPTHKYDVGSHEIEINIPTVLEDFFDLPIWCDFFQMKRFKKPFLTKVKRDIDEAKKNGTNSDDIYVQQMSYLCLLDSIWSACSFRMSRYLKHFSIALIIGGVTISAICIKYPNVVGCIGVSTTIETTKLTSKNEDSIKSTVSETYKNTQ